ncbi:MAG: NTPase [Nitrososphaerota archaeon]|nr:NTPase [Candidatus Bathyarchaeota archaeon]MDW8048968.1 NTPase [Nitrososphaerota archaeon]
MKHILLLTGRPGVGKTTIIFNVAEALRARGFTVGGMISREVREGGVRVGFKIYDIRGSREGWLAHFERKSGPRIGKYGVCLDDLERIGVQAIFEAVKTADVIVIDEIGPMELYSNRFRNAVSAAMESGKILVGTIHYRVSDPFVADIRRRRDVKIIEVDEENRVNLVGEIMDEVLNYLQPKDSS